MVGTRNPQINRLPEIAAITTSASSANDNVQKDNIELAKIKTIKILIVVVS